MPALLDSARLRLKLYRDTLPAEFSGAVLADSQYLRFAISDSSYVFPESLTITIQKPAAKTGGAKAFGLRTDGGRRSSSSTPAVDSTTPRSTTFSSSRTLPGQW